MERTFLIRLNNEKALRLLQELEELDLIKVVKEDQKTEKTDLAAKYRGIMSKEEGESLHKHTEQMRNEWNDT